MPYMMTVFVISVNTEILVCIYNRIKLKQYISFLRMQKSSGFKVLSCAVFISTDYSKNMAKLYQIKKPTTLGY